MYFDVIVIGGGHAGVEACYAAVCRGTRVLLVTDDCTTIGKMSCNPAVGGVGKSHLIYELNSLGGIMGRAADCAGVYFRLLNRSKGAAVHSIRIQVDPFFYKNIVLTELCAQLNLYIVEASVNCLLLHQGCVQGIILTCGKRIYSKSVVIATGTFLGGILAVGNLRFEGGRIGDKSSNILFKNLRNIFLNVCRFRTGTPPRLLRKSINFSLLKKQENDAFLSFFSQVLKRSILIQEDCYETRTTELTHSIIQRNLYKTALYIGAHTSLGPRYCLSIEDKIVRFNKSSHQIFLESDGIDFSNIYLNGLSTSAALSVQYEVIRSIRGFKYAKIVFPGYMVEYDCFDPKDLKGSLETLIGGLFFAGQINGTTGYEEAAAQGIVAGINAVHYVVGKNMWIPDRKISFIGVLIDDLTTVGIIEPYRMFTTRAENRLFFRCDNSNYRILHVLCLYKIVFLNKWKYFFRHNLKFLFCCKQIRKNFPPMYTTELYFSLRTLENYILKEGIFLKQIQRLFWFSFILSSYICLCVYYNVRYNGYVEKFCHKFLGTNVLKKEFKILVFIKDYKEIKGLSTEIVEKLNVARPYILAQVFKISGVTPVSINLLKMYFCRI